MATAASNTTQQDQTSCKVFRRLDPAALTPDSIHRLVVGEDTSLRVLTQTEATVELGDPFATMLLLRGTFPRTAGEVLAAFEQLTGTDDPPKGPMFFLVGDGSQIPVTPETVDLARNMRFLVTLGNGPEGADVLFSSFQPEEGDVELMAWDRATGGFNYYQTVGDSSAWVFAGNSRHALVEPSEGEGPFESHPSGNFIMKELRSPWINWHSPAAPIMPSAFSDDDPLRNHPWVEGKEPSGAITLETSVARPGIERWTRARFAAIVANGGQINRPERIIRQILTSPAINLISSHNVSANAASSDTVELPQTFFVDSSLTDIAGLAPPPPFAVPGEIYTQSLKTFDVKLTDGAKFVQPGDTHFAFVVPERAFEDQAVLAEAARVGLVTPRMAACLLMVDFPNPIFSPRRRGLLAHVPSSATLADGASAFTDAFADAIVAAATEPGTPEREFADRWKLKDGWKESFDAELAAYFKAVTKRLTTQAGFDDCFRLAESRRDLVRTMPIAESPLLFASTNIPSTPRAMTANGTVQEG